MTTPTPIVVTGCADCPFMYDTVRCGHPDTDGKQHGIKTPDWCPLRTSPALAVLRPDGVPGEPL